MARSKKQKSCTILILVNLVVLVLSVWHPPKKLIELSLLSMVPMLMVVLLLLKRPSDHALVHLHQVVIMDHPNVDRGTTVLVLVLITAIMILVMKLDHLVEEIQDMIATMTVTWIVMMHHAMTEVMNEIAMIVTTVTIDMVTNVVVMIAMIVMIVAHLHQDTIPTHRVLDHPTSSVDYLDQCSTHTVIVSSFSVFFFFFLSWQLGRKKNHPHTQSPKTFTHTHTYIHSLHQYIDSHQTITHTEKMKNCSTKTHPYFNMAALFNDFFIPIVYSLQHGNSSSCAAHQHLRHLVCFEISLP